tara:strand:+ start:54 stop:248 length:195 start_codon:yes stop_codon:yes gene_type:complete
LAKLHKLKLKGCFNELISIFVYLPMQKTETQQFSKFFLKDLKTKNPNCNNKKSDIEKWSFSSTD